MEPQALPNLNMCIVGGGFSVLQGEYDRNQLWFNFCSGFVYETFVEAARPAPKDHELVEFEARRSRRKIEPHTKRMYEYVEGVEQYVLPFKEFKLITRNEVRSLERAKFPTWERIDDELAKVEIKQRDKPNTLKKLKEESRGQFFFIGDTTVVFELYDDAMIFALTKN